MGYDQSVYYEEGDKDSIEIMIREPHFHRVVAQAYNELNPDTPVNINEDCGITVQITPQLAARVVELLQQQNIQLHYGADW